MPIRTTMAAAVLALSACAQHPDTVAATPVHPARYAAASCPELGGELARLNEGIAVASTAQRGKRVRDAWGWVYDGDPRGSLMTADARPHLSLLKGERDAVEQALVARCGVVRRS